MGKPKPVGPDGNAFKFGAKVLVERGLATSRDAVPRWCVYRLTDTKDDPDTSLDERWDEVGSYAETEVGVMPAKAIERAEALAEKE